MKPLLVTSAIIEIAAGIAFMAVPALVVTVLLGPGLDSPAVSAMSRLAGAALLSLGVCCWFGSRDAPSRAVVGIVIALLIYNIAAVVLIVSLRYYANMTGVGLVPAGAFHAVLAVWCMVRLRNQGSIH